MDVIITIQAWLLFEYHLNSTLSSICKYGRKSPSTKFYVLMKKESEAHAGSTGVGWCPSGYLIGNTSQHGHIPLMGQNYLFGKYHWQKGLSFDSEVLHHAWNVQLLKFIPKIIGAIGPDRLYQDGYCDASSYAIYIPRRESQIQRLRDWRIAPQKGMPI